MGSLVPLAVRIDVSRLIDRSQPFRAVQPPRLPPAPSDFHPTRGRGRLHEAAAARLGGIFSLVLFMQETAAFQGFGRLGCPYATGWPILEPATVDFESQNPFSRLDATGNPAT